MEKQKNTTQKQLQLRRHEQDFSEAEVEEKVSFLRHI